MDPFTRPPVVMGHRGSPRTAPENTPVSFLAAAEEGARWVELDVRRSADDELVVCHDPVTADGQPLLARTADELASLGIWTFDAVHEVLPPGLGIDIEVKNFPGEPDFDEDDITAHALAEKLAKRADRRPWMTSSFNPQTVAVLADALPGVPAGLLHTAGMAMIDAVEVARDCGARILCPQVGSPDLRPHVGSPDLTGAAVEAVHAEGFAVLVWTVDDLDEAARLASAGVDAICTNTPAKVVARLARGT